MTEPGHGLPKTRVDDTETTSAASRSLEQLDSLNANRLEPLPPQLEELPGPAPYQKERLFSRKVLIGWAAVTLVLWFVITFIVPEVVQTVKSEIESRMEPPRSNTAAPVVAPVPVIVEPVAPVTPVEPPQPPKPVAPKK